MNICSPASIEKVEGLHRWHCPDPGGCTSPSIQGMHAVDPKPGSYLTELRHLTGHFSHDDDEFLPAAQPRGQNSQRLEGQIYKLAATE